MVMMMMIMMMMVLFASEITVLAVVICEVFAAIALITPICQIFVARSSIKTRFRVART